MRKRSLLRLLAGRSQSGPVINAKKRVRKAFYRPFEGHETVRRCVECPRQASAWRFTEDERGGYDKSSRVPVCSGHNPKAA